MATIEKVHIPKAVVFTVVSAAMMLALGAAVCFEDEDDSSMVKAAAETDVLVLPTSAILWEPEMLPPEVLASEVPEETEDQPEPVELEQEPDPWTPEELEAMALTLAGECYDDKPEDKRKVCEVILNRVSTAGFGNTILEVLTAQNQFSGYWRQSRPVTANDYEIAEQALRDWYDNDCQAFSAYLYFSAGKNRENVFRTKF